MCVEPRAEVATGPHTTELRPAAATWAQQLGGHMRRFHEVEGVRAVTGRLPQSRLGSLVCLFRRNTVDHRQLQRLAR